MKFCPQSSCSLSAQKATLERKWISWVKAGRCSLTFNIPQCWEGQGAQLSVGAPPRGDEIQPASYPRGNTVSAAKTSEGTNDFFWRSISICWPCGSVTGATCDLYSSTESLQLFAVKVKGSFYLNCFYGKSWLEKNHMNLLEAEQPVTWLLHKATDTHVPPFFWTCHGSWRLLGMFNLYF